MSCNIINKYCLVFFPQSEFKMYSNYLLFSLYEQKIRIKIGVCFSKEERK